MAGRRRGQRFDAELGVTTEALVFLGELDPERIGPAIEHATHYEPTPVDDAAALLDALPTWNGGATFVDLGSGMGRMLLVASRRTFRAVVGVEVSPALVEIARENLSATVADPLRLTRDVRVVCADAAAYEPPPGDLAVYLYNPFAAPVLERVLDRLERPPGRNVALAYHTPVQRAVLDARPRWTLVTETGGGAVWTLAR